jgi:hypothetical protein
MSFFTTLELSLASNAPLVINPLVFIIPYVPPTKSLPNVDLLFVDLYR